MHDIDGGRTFGETHLTIKTHLNMHKSKVYVEFCHGRVGLRDAVSHDIASTPKVVPWCGGSTNGAKPLRISVLMDPNRHLVSNGLTKISLFDIEKKPGKFPEENRKRIGRPYDFWKPHRDPTPLESCPLLAAH